MSSPLSVEMNPSTPLQNSAPALPEDVTRTLTQPVDAETPPHLDMPAADMPSESGPLPENRSEHSELKIKIQTKLDARRFEEHIGHYEVIRPLGAGGMGSVLLARDTKLGRLVAIKLLHHGGEAAARLLAEARATARARHENIVVIYEIGTIANRPYMVLEYLEGRTLREVISSTRQNGGRVMSRGLALEIMVPVLRALDAAHQNELIHRDLKPENIMVLDSGQVKVLDFGIAKMMDAEGSNARYGTRPYMSPEQWLGGELDGRSDLWAVGIILYELLAGQHPLAPFTDQNIENIKNLNLPLPRLRDLRPDLEGLSDVIGRCTSKHKEKRYGSAKEVLAALEPFLSRPKATFVGEVEHPFAGLSAFQEADGDRFFGRERDITAVLGLLERQPLVTISGASGAGKSSFARAGLIPALKGGGEDWHVSVVRPGRTPVAALQELMDDQSDVDLRKFPLQFGSFLRARCRAPGQSRRCLVFVDQMEELYTLVDDPLERTAFLDCLRGAADDAYSPLRVVLCIRSDFLDRVIADHQFMVHVATGLYFLPPIDDNGQRKALTRPLEAAGYQFESEKLVTRVLEELARTNNPLPLLQFTATKLWEARDIERKLLTQEAYEQMGGVAGTLAKHADTVVLGFSTADQHLCRAILLRLITPERTRAVVYLRELLTLDEDATAVESIVQQLAAARLVTVDADAVQGDAKIEIVHESLITRWPMLGRWLDESAGNAHFLARLRIAAMQWEASGKPTGMLWRDRAADEARGFYERYGQNAAELRAAFVGAIEAEYLQAVLDLSRQTQRTRNRAVVGAFLLVCGIAVVVLVLALDARKHARRADDEASLVRQQNNELAYQALRGRNATRMLAARKNEDDPTLTLAILRETEKPDVPKDWPELTSAALSRGVARDVWRTDPGRCGYAAVMSPDGKRIAVAMDDYTTRILGEDLAEIAALRHHKKTVWSVAWSPDGKRVVSASFDNTASVSNADGSGAPLIFRGHSDALNSAQFSPDGERIVSSADDRTARIWSATDGREIAVLPHESEVNDARWSPDGKRIVTAASNGKSSIWEVDGQKKPLVLRGHTDPVWAASFSPDGKRVAAVSRDRTARIWDAVEGTEELVLRGHEEKILSVFWSPDGRRLATSSKDKTARIWSADGRGTPIVLRGHTHWVYTATWSPSGDQIITTSLDGTQRRFFLDDIVAPTLLEGHDDAIRGLEFSPDGGRIATASMDGTARIWNVDGKGETIVLRGRAGAATFIRWHPKGTHIATLHEDKTARIWALNDFSHPIVMTVNDLLHSVDWSSDGSRLVTTSVGGKITLWSKDGVEIATVKKETSTEYKWIRAYFDRSGKRVLILDTLDPKVHLWNPESNEGLVSVTTFDNPVRVAKWSPDQTHILAISMNGQARLVDALGKDPLVEIHAAKPIRNGAWSVDGRLFLALDDGTLVPHVDGEIGTPIASGVMNEGAGQLHFSAEGTRLLTFTPYGHFRIRAVNGEGVPFILGGTSLAAGQAIFSPQGDRIVATHEDKFAWVWPNIKPFSGTDDKMLWRITSYCIPVEKRIEILGVSEDQARNDEKACKDRVASMRDFKQNP